MKKINFSTLQERSHDASIHAHFFRIPWKTGYYVILDVKFLKFFYNQKPDIVVYYLLYISEQGLNVF